jgi:hypothetical protein
LQGTVESCTAGDWPPLGVLTPDHASPQAATACRVRSSGFCPAHAFSLLCLEAEGAPEPT